MQPDSPSVSALIRRVAGKEIGLFFASPVAWLFLASFAAVTLFIFFWGEAFFARNIADVRPMFEWMPFLLVFLCSTLTMRLWSEERRSGTLEHVLTQPVPLWTFVVGKFIGCLALLSIALAITLPLPLTVALLGELDPGPVFAGYLATFLLGAAYLGIGLFVSARADNQIVSLIAAVALCGAFYLIGTPVVTNFFGNTAGEWLRLLGTGSRFDAITRGVIDLRDLYYYLSLVAVFIALNTYSLERERWSRKGDAQHHHGWQAMTALLLANALGGNLWLGQLTALRIDATAGDQYSISEATRGYLAQLQEPLLLRGYFSAKTHPLLSPLVPQLRDLMQEYAIAGDGRVRVEFIDPVSDPVLEEEANQQYAIRPVPFQVADRYQSSIVSSYFDLLVKYGDEYKVLSFDDLIEVKGGTAAGDIDVQLRNPELDLTQAIRSVLQSYQAGGNLFDTVQDTLNFSAYVSADDKLPEELRGFRATVQTVVDKLAADANGRLTVQFSEPEANGGAIADEIADKYGFRAQATSLFSPERFYFYLTVGNGEQLVQIPLDDMSEASFERNLKAGIKRFARGFTKTVAVVTPAGGSDPYSMPHAQFSRVKEFLGSDVNLQDEDLSDGRVSGDADLLLLLAPENIDTKSLFAVDQFLMQGGTVIAATSPFKANITGDSLSVVNVQSGIEDWLTHHGITLEKKLVMDPQNAAFPVPISRNIGGFSLQDWRMLDYPYFPDVRGDGLNADNPVTADLPQLTLAWSSPITLKTDDVQERSYTTLLQSSAQTWLSESTDVMPAINPDGSSGFAPEGAQAAKTLAVAASGRFTSYFAGQDSPMLASAPVDTATEADATTTPAASTQVSSVIEKSAESARLVVIASNDFLNDQIVQLLGTAQNGEYPNGLQFVANSVDWALEDQGLLAIRSRGNFNRTLPPLEQGEQMVWEYLNYILAAVALGLVAFVQRQRQRARHSRFAAFIAE